MTDTKLVRDALATAAEVRAMFEPPRKLPRVWCIHHQAPWLPCHQPVAWATKRKPDNSWDGHCWCEEHAPHELLQDLDRAELT